MSADYDQLARDLYDLTESAAVNDNLVATAIDNACAAWLTARGIDVFKPDVTGGGIHYAHATPVIFDFVKANDRAERDRLVYEYALALAKFIHHPGRTGPIDVACAALIAYDDEATP